MMKKWYTEMISEILANEQNYMTARFLKLHPELDIEDVEVVWVQNNNEHSIFVRKRNDSNNV